MKMIDVLIQLSKGEIKDRTTLKIHDPVDTLYTYTFNGKSKAFYSNTEYSNELSIYFKLDDEFLNREVELIQPKPKKYCLKLRNNDLDSTNYVNRFEDCFGAICYTFGDTSEREGYQTTFTQAEIDNDKFLRFVERHGVKEEVKET